MERQKIKIEYLMNANSDASLWEIISTAAGLERWFADKVKEEQRKWTFQWSKDEIRQADEVAARTNAYIRFRWTDAEYPREFFELRISSDELTGTRVLVVTDFADADEVDDLKLLWNSEVETLRRVTGF